MIVYYVVEGTDEGGAVLWKDGYNLYEMIKKMTRGRPFKITATTDIDGNAQNVEEALATVTRAKSRDEGRQIQTIQKKNTWEVITLLIDSQYRKIEKDFEDIYFLHFDFKATKSKARQEKIKYGD